MPGYTWAIRWRRVVGNVTWERDILYLSRLSKTFYAFFTRRGAQFMWKSAARNVPGLPPCPADLNEISYAQLLFDAFCHVSCIPDIIACFALAKLLFVARIVMAKTVTLYTGDAE